MRDLYPAIEPYRDGLLAVSDIHAIYFEESGNPHGVPVVFLHGGPGLGTEPSYRQYFDPAKWRIVLFDQRGCGKSTPYGELAENTTPDLVNDIERLREHLCIEAWSVFGGSWGATLGLAYSQKFPERCTSLILRGVFLLRRKELHWLYQEGANFIFPDAWEEFCKPIPMTERHDMLAAYYKRLTSNDERKRKDAARCWAVWEASTSKLLPDDTLIQKFRQDELAGSFARIACHYFVNGGFFENEDQLMRNIDRIMHIPTRIVQGRYDVVCPMVTAWELSRAWPKAELTIISEAGHSITELGIRNALVEATDMLVHGQK